MSRTLRSLFKHRVLVALLALAAVWFTVTLFTTRRACACPPSQTWITYYTDASYSTACGDKVINCDCGVFREGCQTSYYTVEYYPCP